MWTCDFNTVWCIALQFANSPRNFPCSVHDESKRVYKHVQRNDRIFKQNIVWIVIS